MKLLAVQVPQLRSQGYCSPSAYVQSVMKSAMHIAPLQQMLDGTGSRIMNTGNMFHAQV